MEMTPGYAEETARYAASRGSRLEIFTDEKTADGNPVYQSTRYRLTADLEAWILEVASYVDGEIRYFLEIEKYHGLRSRSFPLDSWKFRESHIEFRFQALPDSGLALTFELAYPDRHRSTQPSRS